jgi:predicted phage tail protein
VGANRRCRFNGIFDTLGVGDDAVNAILKVGRASLLKSSEYKVVIETVFSESSFTGLFTGGNIVEDTFNMQWVSKKDRPNAITIEFQDSSAEYERKSFTYYGPEYNLTTDPLRIDRDFLIGCTSEDEAKRYAILRYQLKKMSNATCSFEVSGCSH